MMIAAGHQTAIDHKRRLATERLRRSGLRCSILRPSPALTTDGTPGTGETTIATDVPCMLTDTEAAGERSEQMLAGQLQSVTILSLLVPWDTDVRAQDRVQLADGTRYEIGGGTGATPGRIWLRLPLAAVNPEGSP